MAQFVMEAIVLCEVGGSDWGGAGRFGRQYFRVANESAASHPGGLDRTGAFNLLGRRDYFRQLSRLQSCEPRPHRITAIRMIREERVFGIPANCGWD